MRNGHFGQRDRPRAHFRPRDALSDSVERSFVHGRRQPNAHPKQETKKKAFMQEHNGAIGKPKADHRYRDGAKGEDRKPSHSNAEHEKTFDHLLINRKLKELLRYLSPSVEERNDKLRVLNDIASPLRRIGLEVEVYGSVRTGLLIPASDVDCVMLPIDGIGFNAPPGLQRTLHAVQHSAVMTAKQRQSSFSSGIHAVANAMRRSPLFTRVSSIAHARVPIVKCVHRDTNTKVDLSFEKDGCLTSEFLCKEFQKPGNELARALIVLVKAMLSNWSLDDPSVGGMGSFPTSLLVLWFLQKKSAAFPPELRSNIAVLLVGFLRYYGNEEWDYHQMGMNYVQGISFKKPAGPELCIINPLVPGMNCARSAKLYHSRVIPAFYEAAQTLSRHLDEEVQEKAVHSVLVEYFGDSVDAVHHWEDVVKGGSRKVLSSSQHLWDEDTRVYTGSLINE